MAKKTSLIPKSKAKTAYGLLSEVRASILAEPKRYHQKLWLRHGEGDEFPSCGTMACVAGWVTTLKAPDVEGRAVQDVAQRILGLDIDQEFELFNEEAAKGRPQTIAHARSGAAHIARFQKKYAKQLKAKRV